MEMEMEMEMEREQELERALETEKVKGVSAVAITMLPSTVVMICPINAQAKHAGTLGRWDAGTLADYMS